MYSVGQFVTDILVQHVGSIFEISNSRGLLVQNTSHLRLTFDKAKCNYHLHNLEINNKRHFEV